jgi:hypothetical protein
VHRLPKSLLVPPKFSYVTNYSPKPPTSSLIPLLWDKNQCSLIVMSKGGVSNLNIIAKLMQNWGYVYSILLDFSDKSSDLNISLQYNISYNKCKELLPTRLQFKLDKNPTWPQSWLLLDAFFHCREGSDGPPLKNVMFVIWGTDLQKTLLYLREEK